MPKKQPESFNYLSNNPEFVPDPEIEAFMEEEIAHAPKDPEMLAQRLRNSAASPADAGGDLDADCWWRQSYTRPIDGRRECAGDGRQLRRQ